jgi:hypothetical protein
LDGSGAATCDAGLKTKLEQAGKRVVSNEEVKATRVALEAVMAGREAAKSGQ